MNMMSLQTDSQTDIRGHREVTLPMIVAAGGMGERRVGPGMAVVDWGNWRNSRKMRKKKNLTFIKTFLIFQESFLKAELC